jgi:hypothetical protein
MLCCFSWCNVPLHSALLRYYNTALQLECCDTCYLHYLRTHCLRLGGRQSGIELAKSSSKFGKAGADGAANAIQ